MLQNQSFFKNWRLFLGAGALGNSNGPKSTILCVPANISGSLGAREPKWFKIDHFYILAAFFGAGALGNQNGPKSIIFYVPSVALGIAKMIQNRLFFTDQRLFWELGRQGAKMVQNRISFYVPAAIFGNWGAKEQK